MLNGQEDLITKKQAYEAMLHMLKTFWEETGSNDLTDILSGGEYWPGTEEPADSAFWEDWIEALEKLKLQVSSSLEIHNVLTRPCT